MNCNYCCYLWLMLTLSNPHANLVQIQVIHIAVNKYTYIHIYTYIFTW